MCNKEPYATGRENEVVWHAFNDKALLFGAGVVKIYLFLFWV